MELLELFHPAKSRLPSYSTIRRVMLKLDYQDYSRCLRQFFQIEPVAGETIAMDGKVLHFPTIDRQMPVRQNLIQQFN